MQLKFYNKKLAYYTSSKLGTPNAFFTRLGGVSEGCTSSLNLAFGRGDEKERVLENLSLCGEALGFAPESVVSCPQIHSADILKVDESHKGLGYCKESEIALDGYITEKKGITLGVKTADCVPILLSVKKDGKAVVVSAVHSGWRGSTSGIAKKAVEGLVSLGYSPENIFAAIGPCASVCCYEVGEEVISAAKECFGTSLASRYFKLKTNGKYMADLKGFNAAILHASGVPYENIDICEACTICEERYFYSHRRDGEKRGTHLSIIFMNE